MGGGSGQGPQAPLTGQLDLQLWASARPTRCTGSVARPACRPAPTRSTAAPASAPSAASAQKVRASPSQDPLAEPRAGPPCPQPQAGSQDPRPQTLHWDLPQRRLCLPGPHPQGARRWRCRACHHGAAPREGVGPRGRALHDPTGGGGVPQPQPQEAPLLQGWFWMTSQKTTAVFPSPSAPACSAGWFMPPGRSQQPPARPGECRAAGEGMQASGEMLGNAGSCLSPIAGARGATGNVRSGPAHGAVPWREAPSSPRSTPGPSASMAPAPTSLSR